MNPTNVSMDDIKYTPDVFVAERDVYESSVPETPGVGGILRTIKGPVAGWDTKNRNGRMYSEKLWDNVLDSPYVTEQLRYHTLFGEAGHPQDRYEVDFGRVSHSITEMWKVPSSNQIYATINILDTPLGRIINTLYEAGGVIGYSSRAGGTLHQRKDYIEVDEKSYNFITFDAVPFPSVDFARPQGLNEGTKMVQTLSDEVHDKICTIIKESGFESKSAVKDFIYSLETYDMSKEKSLFDIDESHDSLVKSENDSDATKSLLKDFSLKIDSLQAENSVLQRTNESLKTENIKMRKNLDISFQRIQDILAESKNQRDGFNITESEFDNTIREKDLVIEGLNSTIQDIQVELDMLRDIDTARKTVMYENASLRQRQKDTALLESKVSELNRLLEESYGEITKMIEESNEKDNQITLLEGKIDTLESEGSENQKLFESSQKNLSVENTRLRSEIDSLNESVEVMESQVDKYRDELISTICEGYNLSVDSVKSRLKRDFSRSDIYCVCEGMTSSVREGIPTIVSEVDSKRDIDESTNKVGNEHPSKVNYFGSNRRGRLL